MINTKYLVMTRDIAKLVGVVPQAVSNWTGRRESFPVPVVRLANKTYPVWDVRDVEAWLKSMNKIDPLTTLTQLDSGVEISPEYLAMTRDVARMLGKTPQGISNLKREVTFPTPVVWLANDVYPVWDVREVEEWFKTWPEIKAGRAKSRMKNARLGRGKTRVQVLESTTQ